MVYRTQGDGILAICVDKLSSRFFAFLAYPVLSKPHKICRSFQISMRMICEDVKTVEFFHGVECSTSIDFKQKERILTCDVWMLTFQMKS